MNEGEKIPVVVWVSETVVFRFNDADEADVNDEEVDFGPKAIRMLDVDLMNRYAAADEALRYLHYEVQRALGAASEPTP